MQIFNSLSKQKEIFQPHRAGHVLMYACGVTVYDYFHIGNGRMLIVFDMVARYLRYKGYQVRYVQNITDIDDKIIKKAQEQGVSWTEVTAKYIKALEEDRRALGVLEPDQSPKATEFISQMIETIQKLIDKSYAYVASNGDVLYNIKEFKEYGKLSHRKLENLRAGARVEIEEHKRDPLDFVLWKMAKPGEPSWDSPWGKGRPGWHIECSVMAGHCLAEQIDIHGGGMDLKFPHHENEIAQTEACTGKPFAKYWMHNGFLQIDNEKMSKSLGNFFLTRDALQHYSGEQLRFFMLSTHYRQPINYTVENLQQAGDNLTRLYQSLRHLDLPEATVDSEYERRFQAAMDDDFNTPEAFTVLYDLVREINRHKQADEISEAVKLAAILKKLAGVLGLLERDPEQFFKIDDIDARVVEELIDKRKQARLNKNWVEADQVRVQLDSLGVVLEDTAQGTTWRKK